jgi:hypothetical protein
MGNKMLQRSMAVRKRGNGWLIDIKIRKEQGGGRIYTKPITALRPEPGSTNRH